MDKQAMSKRDLLIKSALLFQQAAAEEEAPQGQSGGAEEGPPQDRGPGDEGISRLGSSSHGRHRHHRHLSAASVSSGGIDTDAMAKQLADQIEVFSKAIEDKNAAGTERLSRRRRHSRPQQQPAPQPATASARSRTWLLAGAGPSPGAGAVAGGLATAPGSDDTKAPAHRARPLPMCKAYRVRGKVRQATNTSCSTGLDTARVSRGRSPGRGL